MEIIYCIFQKKKLINIHNYYKVIQNNTKLIKKKGVIYNNEIDYIKLKTLLEHFKINNIKKKEVRYIINNYENLIINKIEENG